MTSAGLSFVRRSFEGGWDYFIANRGDKFSLLGEWVPLGRAAKAIGVLDPITGKSGVASLRRTNGVAQVYLTLGPGESIILRAFADREITGAPWKFFDATMMAGEQIAGEWHVDFISGGPTLPASFATTKLASWTELGDTNAQSFAGTAKYTITFDAPGIAKSSRLGSPWALGLGKVCQSARVTLNGKDYGTLITPPFRVVVDNLKPTDNQLEVEVTSVGANRIRDLDRRGVNWKYFKDINIVNVNYRPFNAADWRLSH